MGKQAVGFAVSGNKGFHVTFENGYTVSVQFGPGNYCTNRDAEYDLSGKKSWASFNAEVAVWPEGGGMLQLKGWNDSVKGWQSPAEVLKLLNWAARQKEAV